ncbi:hypothetical protein HV096_00390 [Citrobacter freundii]|nr:fimbrial protein [Citrobacter freundii]HEE0120794.1 hypothetical protein [Citrobacter gillenii]EJB8472631.1 hypothetical protein [Citrobacter freundii]EJB8560966.1 hypothetical protein [Citrobacter freundii]MBA8030634.1 hypothetical protein [Citrobacter freundii]QLO05556.1 hypothetical protein HV141_19435 [Citrobacter freundii]
MKLFPMLSVLFPLFSLQAWAEDTVTPQSTSRDYVITGRIVDGTCTLLLMQEYQHSSTIYFGTVVFGMANSTGVTKVTNEVPEIGEPIVSKEMALGVQCPGSMLGATVTVKITTRNEVDSSTHAIKNGRHDKDGEGDFGIMLRNTDNDQDIDFTDATATSVELVPSTTDGASAQAEVNYQVNLVRYGNKVVDVPNLDIPIMFNVTYE